MNGGELDRRACELARSRIGRLESSRRLRRLKGRQREERGELEAGFVLPLLRDERDER